ncbi:MAG: hypothetical protein ACOYKA_05660 [Legionellaceae bacterium]
MSNFISKKRTRGESQTSVQNNKQSLFEAYDATIEDQMAQRLLKESIPLCHQVQALFSDCSTEEKQRYESYCSRSIQFYAEINASLEAQRREGRRGMGCVMMPRLRRAKLIYDAESLRDEMNAIQSAVEAATHSLGRCSL